MYIDRVPNRNSPPAVLLRESFREDGKVKKRTLANLSMFPDETIELMRASLKGRQFVPADQNFIIDQTLPHGHVAAVTGIMKKLRMASLLGGGSCRERDLVLALIASRILKPASKLSTSRLWETSTLGDLFDVGDAGKDELYAAMDWLLERQETIEKRLAKRHLEDGSLVLYDLTSTYLEGRKCPLAFNGYSRDHRPDKMQIEFGLMTDRDGRPIAVEVFEGNTADPMTLSVQVEKLRERFKLREMIIVGDRGMITRARIREDLKPNKISWITALRHADIRQLAEGPLQLGLFDDTNFAEIESPDYPNERLIACRNPNLAEEVARKRKELLAVTEAKLEKVKTSVKAGRLVDCGAIGGKVQAILKRYRMARFFDVVIANGEFTYNRKEASIAQESELDGIYVIRSNVVESTMGVAETVHQYKSLARVEKAFRTIKTGLDVRPVFHHLADRVRAHVFLCVLAYYVEWEMRRRLAPLLFAEEKIAQNNADPVAAKKPSEESRRKTGSRRSKSGLPLHSFETLLENLTSLARNRCKWSVETACPVTFFKMTESSLIQKETFRLLEISL